MSPGRVAYLCLEAPREGQASFAHTHEIVAGLRQLGWPVDLYMPSYWHKWRRPSLSLRFLEQLRVELLLLANLRNYRLIYVRAHPLGWPVGLACRWSGKPIVQEVNGPLVDIYIAHPRATPFRSLLSELMVSQYRWATGLVAVTPGLAGWLRTEIGSHSPVAVIPNGSNIRLFCPEAETTAELPSQFVVFVGALVPWHDVPVILRATEHQDWPATMSLVLVGSCCELEEARASAAKDSRIRLLGRVPYADVAGIVAKSRAALVTIADAQSRATTGVCPIKLFEAMACGVPIIATDLEYQAELIRTIGAGIVFPPGDVAALAAAVAEIAGDRQRAAAMGQRAHAAARSAHSWELRAKETGAFLISLILAEEEKRPALRRS